VAARHSPAEIELIILGMMLSMLWHTGIGRHECLEANARIRRSVLKWVTGSQIVGAVMTGVRWTAFH
jgi:hypothetical protein